MKLILNTVTGTTSKAGKYQQKVYTFISKGSKEVKNRSRVCDLSRFYIAVDKNGTEYSIWNINGDWSTIGISIKDKMRINYTKDFTIEGDDSELPLTQYN